MTTATLRRMVRAMIEATGWPASAAADAVAENLAADDETRERLTKIRWRNALMADRTPLIDLTKAIVPHLVSYKAWGDASFVNMPLVYPSGAFVTVRLTHAPGGVRVSDSGFAYRETESFGAGRSFSRTAQNVADEYELSLGKRTVFVDVPEHEVERAILDVSAASHAIATRIVERASSDAEVTISDELHERLDRLFPQTTYDDKIVGASSTEWEVSAISKFDGETAVFQIVTNYPANPMIVGSDPVHLTPGGTMSAMREDIWRDLYAKRDALIAAIEAAHASPPRDFTEGDRREWQEIEHALDYTPQKWADQQRSE